jgi:hypothetical protein
VGENIVIVAVGVEGILTQLSSKPAKEKFRYDKAAATSALLPVNG